MNEQPVPSTATEVLTGSTGNSLRDGGVRGMIPAAIQSVLLVFVVQELGILTDAQLVALGPAITLISFVSWGIYDRIQKGA